MSKYRDALERILCEGTDEVVLENPTFENIRASARKTSIAIEILEEAISKAEKYDETCDSSEIDLVVEFDELGMSPTALVPDVKECEDIFRRRILALIKENQELKEENQILKDGIKATFDKENGYVDTKNLICLDYVVVSFSKNYKKIKAMLEVIENE